MAESKNTISKYPGNDFQLTTMTLLCRPELGCKDAEVKSAEI